MLISHLHRFIYLKTIKTGGTSVEIYFERFCVDPGRPFVELHSRDEEVTEWGIIGARQRPIENQIWYNHLPASGVRALIGEDIWQSYYKFCVVRNPFDKVVSSFWYSLTDADRAALQEADFTLVRRAFSHFVEVAGLPQDRIIYTLDGKAAVDRFVRYENLTGDLERVCQDLSLPWEPSLLGKYKSGFRVRPEHFSLYYDSVSAKRVRREYNWELSEFGYENIR